MVRCKVRVTWRPESILEKIQMLSLTSAGVYPSTMCLLSSFTYNNILLFSLCMRCLFTSLTYYFIVPTTSRILVFWIHHAKTQVKCQLTMWLQLPARGLCCIRPPRTHTHTLTTALFPVSSLQSTTKIKANMLKK